MSYVLEQSRTDAERALLKERIVEHASKAFAQRGIRQVKMDELAATMSISKRTLYELYANKEKLLLEGVIHEYDEQVSHIRRFALSGRNEMEIVAEFVRCKLNAIQNTNPQFFIELHKYESIKKYLLQRRDSQRQQSIEFINNGIAHGYFLKDINYDLLVELSDTLIDNVLEHDTLRKYSLNEILRNFTIVLMRGFSTQKGINVIDEYYNGLR